MQRQPNKGLGVGNRLFDSRDEIAREISQQTNMKIEVDHGNPALFRFAVSEWDKFQDFKTADRWTKSKRIVLMEIETSLDRQKIYARLVLGPAPRKVREKYYNALIGKNLGKRQNQNMSNTYTRMDSELISDQIKDFEDEEKSFNEIKDGIVKYALGRIPAYHGAFNGIASDATQG
jgi:hypothetical protein